MQSACAELYRHLWPVWLYHIFPHYLKNGTIFGKTVIDFLYNCCLKYCSFYTELSQIWPRIYNDLSVKYPLFLSDLNETWILKTDFRKMRKYKISWISISGSRAVPCGRTDEQAWRRQQSLFAIVLTRYNVHYGPSHRYIASQFLLNPCTKRHFDMAWKLVVLSLLRRMFNM
jgi:hypothetical protein